MSLSSILVPNSGCLFGVYPGTTCDSSSTSGLVLLHNHETQIQRTAATNGLLNIVHFYHDWDDFVSTFPTVNEDTLVAEGRLLFVNWTPRIYGSTTIFPWADIAAGAYDAQYVDPTARKMRDWGQKFFLAFHSEPNAGSSAQGGPYGTDAEYAAAAQHVHDRFIAQGCINAVWVFNPSGYTTTVPTRINALYGAGGDSVFDWIGYDPYSGGATGSWEDVDYVLTTKYPMYNWATVTKSGSHTKPQMWVEWGAEESGGVPGAGTYPNSKAGYFDQVYGRDISGYAGIKSTLPLVKAIVYFNSTSSTGDCVNTSPAALSAYRRLAADPYFNPDMSDTPPPPAGTIQLRGTSSAAINKAKTVGVPVPATAQAGDGMDVFLGVCRSSLINACEGTNGTNVSVANSNSSGSNPWDFTGSVPPTYSTAQFQHGASSMHPSVSAQSTSVMGWTSAAFGTPSVYYGRAYFRIPSVPPAHGRLYQQAGPAGTPNQWGLGIDVTTGKLTVRDLAAGANRWVSAAAPALNAWHRVEWKATWTGTQTTVDVRLYSGANLETLTLTDSGTSTAIAQAAAFGRGYFGIVFSAAQTWDAFLDSVALDTSGWLGPAATTAVITAPPSLVLIGSDDNIAGPVALSTRAYRKTIAAGDPGSTLTFATDVEVHGAVLLECWSGTDPTALEDVIATPAQRQSNATTITSPTAPTTTVAGDRIITAAFDRALAGSAANTSWSVASETVRSSAFGTGTDGRVSGAVSDDGVGHAVGIYGGRVATAVATSFLASAWTLAIRPAVSGGGDTQSVGMVGIPS